MSIFVEMNEAPKYSVIIPVYNRPEEMEELLQSLGRQTFRDFEVIIVEDGSSRTSEMVYEKFSSTLSIQYFYKPNSGPGPSRNFGFQKASGSFFVVFDSDCILPDDYFDQVEKFMSSSPLDAWGGPDRGNEKFTPLQQAMAYTMSSVLSTGGIRGGKNQADRFQPRSFNMGISRTVFEKTGGFNFDRQAEDIEWSIRIKKAGFKVALIPDAFVYHKRRATLGQFYDQVKGFGAGRAKVGKVHPEEIKVTHWFPLVFMCGVISTPIAMMGLPVIGNLMGLGLSLYLIAIFADGLRTTGSMRIAFLCVICVLVQFAGYGWGFIVEKFKR